MHPLLDRQLRKAFAGENWDTPEMVSLLRAVDAAYYAADEDRKQLERSLHIASEELFERNRRLEQELEERHRLEIELRLAEKLRAMGQLAAGVAHEINTPVQFIGDSLRFLREAFADIARVLQTHEGLVELPGGSESGEWQHATSELGKLCDDLELSYLKSEVPKALVRCLEGTDRVAQIVRALKTLAHPDGCNQALADLHGAIENTLVIAASELKYHAEVELDLRATRRVRCHIGEIQQVLLNLLVNAGHAVSDRWMGGSQKGWVKVSTRDDGDDVVITVADNGSGIPIAVQDRIFEPFFTTKPVGKGSGQGLSIARTLVVERHAGQLRFESVPGEGTKFTVRLPVAGTSSPAQVASRAEEAA